MTGYRIGLGLPSKATLYTAERPENIVSFNKKVGLSGLPLYDRAFFVEIYLSTTTCCCNKG